MKKSKFYRALALFLLLPLYIQSKEIPETMVRVLILQNADSVNVDSNKEFLIFDLTNGNRRTLFPNQIHSIETDETYLKIGSAFYGGLVRIIPAEEEPIRVNGKSYRDSLLIKIASPNSITVINELDINHYLYGILPKEVSAEWPMDALKAQAIVSRTFALKNLHRHDAEGFHLCNKVHCQVYGGLDSEEEKTNQAVDKTNNEVLTYKGELINSVFFANCGGKTENTLNAWATDFSPPYLKSVKCKYCRNSDSHQWKNTISQRMIVEALEKSGYLILAPIRSITIASYGKSERAKFLNIAHAGGKLKIRASHFRMSLGPETIRSTLFKKIQKRTDEFYFSGRGWGHGIGMCQDGARGMAERRINYKRILQFYFPGTKIERWDD